MNSKWNDKIKHALSVQQKHAGVARPEAFTFQGLGNLGKVSKTNIFFYSIKWYKISIKLC